MTMAITVAIAPAVWRIRPPMASANSPSTVRYKIAPMTARVTPGWLSVMETWLRRIAVVMKNTANTVTALTTRTSRANVTALAASIRSRMGTASSEERMAPVVYSLVITITPSTQMASWPRPSPAPKITAVGSAEEPGVVGMITRRVPVVRDDRRDQGRKADRHDHEDEQRPHGGLDGADLRPFRAQQAAEAEPGRPGGRPGSSDGAGALGACAAVIARSVPRAGAPRRRLSRCSRRTPRCRRSAP